MRRWIPEGLEHAIYGAEPTWLWLISSFIGLWDQMG
jgi:hypothetical protein